LKKILIISLLLFSTSAYSGELDVAAKIIEKIASALIKNQTITVYARTPYERKIINHSDKMRLAQQCEKADFLLLKSDQDIPSACQESMIFFTQYKAFKRHPNGVGAFFWQKGRVNILFLQKRLTKFNITLPPEWQSYTEEKL